MAELRYLHQKISMVIFVDAHQLLLAEYANLAILVYQILAKITVHAF
jgi:hypothetical protein